MTTFWIFSQHKRTTYNTENKV